MSLHRSERHFRTDAPDTQPSYRITPQCFGGPCNQGRGCNTPEACWRAEMGPPTLRQELVSFWEELVSLVFFWRK